MSKPTRSFPVLGLILGLCAPVAGAQTFERPNDPDAPIWSNQGLITLDYQVIKVPGDAPIDLLGAHLYAKLGDRLYLGVGAHAPHVKGAYGGFMAFDAGVHFRQPLGGPWYLTADLSGGGGGGGRSVKQSKVLSGTGGFVRGSLGLAYDHGPYAIGAGLTRMKFQRSLIDSTQAQVFVSIPYSYLSSAYRRHAEPLVSEVDRRTLATAGENMLAFSLDNMRQIDPQGSNKGDIRTVDLQYAHFIDTDTYWFAALGVGYAGLPIYNQLIGGLGQRVRLSKDLNLYAQLGMGSGGYAPSVIDTGPGLLIYPKLSLERMLSRQLGLSLSAGYLTAPRGSSRNRTYALTLTHHLGSAKGQGEEPGDPAGTWSGFRVGAFQQTGSRLKFDGVDRSALRMVGVQIDKPLNAHWYLPIQAAVAYNDYLGYPGYGELLTGLGVQTAADAGEKLQFFGQLMGGANVHGPGAKVSGGVRYLMDDRFSVHLTAGRIATRSRTDQKFSANSLSIGVDYRFAVPSR